LREIRGAKGIAGDLFRDADFKGLISQKAVSEEFQAGGTSARRETLPSPGAGTFRDNIWHPASG
jgi:hypothetical protein